MTAVGERVDLLDEDQDIANPSHRESLATALRESLATALRLVTGWLCVAIAVLDLLVELDRHAGAPDGPYLFFHVTLLAGGILLLALAWLEPRPGRQGYLAGAAGLAAGLLFSALPATSQTCCMAADPARHGFPFAFLGTGDGWHLDGRYLLADLLFWGYLGLIGLILVALFRRGAGGRAATGRSGEQPRRKTVGPLP